MKKFLIIFLLFAIYFFPFSAFAQTINKEVYATGIITSIPHEETTISDGGYSSVAQTINIQFLDGNQKGKTIQIVQSTDGRLAAFTKYNVNQTVVIDQTIGQDGSIHYTITDSYRIPQLIFLFLLFIFAAFLFARKKGLGAVVGLCISLAIIIFYIVPQILFNQQDPLTVCLIGSFAILFITTFLAHGFSRQTAIAVAATFLALVATYFLSVFCVWLAHLAGLGTEDSYLLEISPTQSINPQGLLLGGIIISTLGALNDITTTQVAGIVALFKANSEQKFMHLFTHGMNIGREHIASLINTLVLAYAGTSLPIFILLVLNPNHLPLWVVLNSQQFAEEIVRTIAGSIGLMLSVPISTLLAAYFVKKVIPHPA